MSQTATQTQTETETKRHNRVTEFKHKASSRWRAPTPYVSHGGKSVEGQLNEDGTAKKARKSKTATKLRRHAHFLQVGKGSIGIRVRRSRIRRHLKAQLVTKIADYAELLGADEFGTRSVNPFKDTESGRWTIWNSFVTPFQAAVDSTIVQIMAQAYSYACARHAEYRVDPAEIDDAESAVVAKKKHGIKLLRSDMAAAIYWYVKLKSE